MYCGNTEQAAEAAALRLRNLRAKRMDNDLAARRRFVGVFVLAPVVLGRAQEVEVEEEEEH